MVAILFFGNHFLAKWLQTAKIYLHAKFRASSLKITLLLGYALYALGILAISTRVQTDRMFSLVSSRMFSLVSSRMFSRESQVFFRESHVFSREFSQEFMRVKYASKDMS